MSDDDVVRSVDVGLGKDDTVEVETIRWSDGSFTVKSVYRRDGYIDRQDRRHDHTDPEYTGRVGCQACAERLAVER